MTNIILLRLQLLLLLLLAMSTSSHALWIGPVSMSRRMTQVCAQRRRNKNMENTIHNKNIITFDTFWKGTNANWTRCETPNDREPNFISKSQSAYYDIVGEGIIRTSDHWTGQHGVYNIVDCQWNLVQIDNQGNQQQDPHNKGQIVSAFCPYHGFQKSPTHGRKTMNQRGISLQQKQKDPTTELVQSNIDFGNFWRNTKADFTMCDTPDQEPNYTSKSGSMYWDQGDAVVRSSDHWTGQHGVSKIVDCHWTLDQEILKYQTVTAKCTYEDFRKQKSHKDKKKVSWRKLSH